MSEITLTFIRQGLPLRVSSALSAGCDTSGVPQDTLVRALALATKKLVSEPTTEQVTVRYNADTGELRTVAEVDLSSDFARQFDANCSSHHTRPSSHPFKRVLHVLAIMKVVITGASGLLGRAVTRTFRAKADEVVALALSRADRDSSYTKLDLLDESAVRTFFSETKPDAVIHCAAERRPDVAEADPEKARLINAVVPSTLANLSLELGFKLVYISTDYVFDGFNPPYEVDDEPAPLQMYGRLKRDGEVATLEQQAKGAKATVLRVPILYGRAEYNAESAVNILVDVVRDQSGKEYKMDDYQIRYPTNVEDVARVLFDMTRANLPPILHYSSPHKMTKYDMTKVIAGHLGLPIDHVKADSQAPPKPKAGETPRPGNTQLSVKALEDLGIDVSEAKSFSDWWATAL